jgi:uncharacterized coiled-coil protein SlyX
LRHYFVTTPTLLSSDFSWSPRNKIGIRMKLVIIARVKDGLGIIEPFVRHHAQHFVKLIVLDEGSSDGTCEVLQQLQRVYQDLVVLRQPTIGNKPHQYMMLLLRMAVDKFAADWVASIHADEFIVTADGLVLSQVLAGRQPTVYRLEWNKFTHAPDLDQNEERTQVLQQRFHFPPRPEAVKLLIHAQFITRTTELSVGNHSLMDGGRPVPTQPLDRVRLFHYPVRSVAQYYRALAGIVFLQDRLQLKRELITSQEKGEKQAEQLSELNNRLVTSEEKAERQAEQLSELNNRLVASQEKAERHTEQLSELNNRLVASQEKADRHVEQLSELNNRLVAARKKAVKHAKQLSELNNRLVASQEKVEKQAEQLSELNNRLVVSQEKAEEQAEQLSYLHSELLSAQEKIARQTRQLESRTFRFFTRVHGVLIRAKIVRQRR